MAKTYGYNTAVRINGTPYRIATARVQYRSETHDVTSTEFTGGDGLTTDTERPRRERGVGLGECEVTMTAFLDPTIAVHVAPLDIRIQSTIDEILIYPSGLDHDPDTITDLLVDDVTKDPVGDPQQPNKITFHGFSGSFDEAGVT